MTGMIVIYLVLWQFCAISIGAVLLYDAVVTSRNPLAWFARAAGRFLIAEVLFVAWPLMLATMAVVKVVESHRLRAA